MQLSDIRTNIRNRFGIDANDPQVPDSVLTEFINASLRTANNERDWRWLEKSSTISAVAGTSEYAFPSDLRKVLDIWESGSNEILEYRTPKDMITLNTYKGTPRFWTTKRGKLVIYPTPQEARTLNIEYIATQTDLVNDTDAPVWPDWAMDYIIAKAGKRLGTRLSRTDIVQLASLEEQEVRDALKDEVTPKGRNASLPRRRRDVAWF